MAQPMRKSVHHVAFHKLDEGLGGARQNSEMTQVEVAIALNRSQPCTAGYTLEDASIDAHSRAISNPASATTNASFHHLNHLASVAAWPVCLSDDLSSSRPSDYLATFTSVDLLAP